jgi:hypothetical protein
MVFENQEKSILRTGGVENVENKLTKNLNQFNDDGTKGYILTTSTQTSSGRISKRNSKYND